MKREVLVATPHNCKYGQYSIRRDFLLAWSKSVDEFKKNNLKKNYKVKYKTNLHGFR